MQHVAHLTTVHRPFDTRVFRKECCTLAQEGYNVSLIAPHPTREIVEGVELIPIPGLKDRLARGARFTRGILGAYRIARRLQADLYHFHDPELLPVGLLLKLMTQTRVVYDVHESYPQNMQAKEWLPVWARAISSWSVDRMERFVAARIDGIVAATEYIAKRFPPSKTRVVRNYPLPSILDQPTYHQCSYQNNHTLIYTGGITDHRGILQIVRALEYVTNPEVKLVLLGGHIHRQTERDVKKSLGWRRVEYLGQTPYQDMFQYLQLAAIGLVCNQPVYSYDLALPNKLFEYMAAGLPVIASDFDLWREIVKGNKCGITVDPTCPQQIAKAIEYLIERPELRHSMGRNGRQAVREKYNWTSESFKLLQLYREVLQEC
jgi:glycosyltransferase involved in cell wall biosynthesis